MVKVQLTQGQYSLIAPEDANLVLRFNWYANYDPKVKSFYAVTKYKQKMFKMHRLIMFGSPEGARALDNRNKLIDHKNRNTLDNRRENLRFVTDNQNSMNQRPQVGKKSRYKGICWYPRHKLWAARIFVDGKRKFLGFSKSEVEAARSYDAAAIKNYGEFACLNFPC